MRFKCVVLRWETVRIGCATLAGLLVGLYAGTHLQAGRTHPSDQTTITPVAAVEDSGPVTAERASSEGDHWAVPIPAQFDRAFTRFSESSRSVTADEFDRHWDEFFRVWKDHNIEAIRLCGLKATVHQTCFHLLDRASSALEEERLRIQEARCHLDRLEMSCLCQHGHVLTSQGKLKLALETHRKMHSMFDDVITRATTQDDRFRMADDYRNSVYGIVSNAELGELDAMNLTLPPAAFARIALSHPQKAARIGVVDLYVHRHKTDAAEWLESSARSESTNASDSAMLLGAAAWLRADVAKKSADFRDQLIQSLEPESNRLMRHGPVQGIQFVPVD